MNVVNEGLNKYRELLLQHCTSLMKSSAYPPSIDNLPHPIYKGISHLVIPAPYLVIETDL